MAMSEQRLQRLEELADKREIEDVILRYCRGIDRVDVELIRSCYHPDATEEHGSFRGTLDEYMDWVTRLISRYNMSMHFVGNVLVELGATREDGIRSARCETYGIAHHRSESHGPDANLIVGFRYIDRFEHRDESGWRIAARVCTTEWVRVDDEAGRSAIPEDMRVGKRDRSDPVYDPID